jgi:two-component system sensor histidine kinase TctE
LSRPIAPPSLVGRLLLTLVGSLTVVAIILGIGGAWLINGIVERTADRLLGASARAIAETLAVEDGEITLDLPPFALGMLENTERDNIYYSVRHDGVLITGYPNLAPAPTGALPLEQSTFRYDTFRGSRIRVAAEARRLPRIPGVIVVEVAETLEARHELARRMLVGLAVLEAAFIGVAALLVWPAVRWSLGPVTRLRQQMDARPADHADFAELPLTDVPVELAGLVIGFNALLRRLESSVEGMRRFTADASHQMRTPLAILRTHLAVLRKHPPPSEAGRNSVSDIAHATDRLQSLLTGLVTLARATDTAQAAVDPALDLVALARAVATDYAPAAAKSHVNVQLDAPDDPVPAIADPLLAKEMLANLVDNAIRYNKRNGHVVVRVRPTDDGPAIEVEDDGPGVPPADRDRIFQRFYRLPRDQYQVGSGLGLPIVQAIAHRIGARVMIDGGAGDRGLLVRVVFGAAA